MFIQTTMRKTFKTAAGFELLRINRQVKPLHGWMFVETDSVLMYIAETFGSCACGDFLCY